MIKSVLPRWAAWTASAQACMPHQAKGGTYVHWFSYLKIVFKLCLKSRAAAELSVTKYVPSSCQFLTESRFTCDRSATVAGDCGSVDRRWCNNYAGLDQNEQPRITYDICLFNLFPGGCWDSILGHPRPPRSNHVLTIYFPGFVENMVPEWHKNHIFEASSEILLSMVQFLGEIYGFVRKYSTPKLTVNRLIVISLLKLSLCFENIYEYLRYIISYRIIS
jgi:hypothetical protein